jgi:putative chitinase
MNVAQLSRVLPKAPVAWLAELVTQMPEWGIDTPNEIASFLAQLAHESDEFTRLEENLNYSARRLMQVWPKRFPTLADAEPFAFHPEALANRVYANRMGNGNELTGDGWRFRGRGPIQLTGRSNYQKCGDAIDEPLELEPGLLLQPRVGIRSACWFWSAAGLDVLDDDDDVRAETRKINGGEHGLLQRDAYFRKALHILTN